MLIVADAEPILSFVRADYFDLLRGVVGTLTIPEAVYAEIVVQGAGKPDAEDVRQDAGIRRETVADRSFVETTSRKTASQRTRSTCSSKGVRWCRVGG